MDEPRDYHTKWSQTEKEDYSLSMWSLKNDISEIIYITETDLQASERNLWLATEERWGMGKIN